MKHLFTFLYAAFTKITRANSALLGGIAM